MAGAGVESESQWSVMSASYRRADTLLRRASLLSGCSATKNQEVAVPFGAIKSHNSCMSAIRDMSRAV